MLDASQRVLREVKPHDKEHVQPVTTAQGEAYFPTIGASFLVVITWTPAAASHSQSLIKVVQGVSKMVYKRKK